MTSKPLRIAFAVAVTAALFVIAIRPDVYNLLSPREITHVVLGQSAPDVPHPWWLSLHIWLRKFYSIIAFAVVGVSVDRALAPASRPRLRAATIVAGFSLAIELAQSIVVPQEPFGERAVDIACGFLGGWLGVSVATLVVYLRSHASLPGAGDRHA